MRRVSSNGIDKKILIIIPLLREQKRITKLLEQFSELLMQYSFLHLILVTTERETKESKNNFIQTTSDELSNSKLFRSLPNGRKHLFHYPFYNQTLAEQLNFTIQEIDRLRLADENDYILIYNADSKINSQAIDLFNECVSNNILVAQQSSLFLNNFDFLIKNNSFLAAGDAIFQSSWTLLHEIPRFLITSNLVPFVPSIVSQNWFSHCVSDGLLIKFYIIKSIGFPETKIGLEDSALGFYLRAQGISIFPIKQLENSDAAENLRSLIRQKSTWLRGPLGSIEYFLNSLKATKSKTRSLLLMLQGIYVGLKWALGGIVIVFFFIACLYNKQDTNFYLLYFFYCLLTFISVLIVWHYVSEKVFPRVSFVKLFPVFILYPLVPIIHSWSGLYGLFKIIKQLIFKNKFIQYKTEIV